MFNIKNIVNKITERGRESQPNSPGRVQDDALSKQVAEGFLCPRCMTALPSQEDLQKHYISSHDGDTGDQSEGFLCPKCMKVFSTPDELEAHFLTTHGAEAGEMPLPWEDSEQQKQLQNACSAMPERINVQGITDPEELKRLLVEAMESKNTLLQEKERLEQRAAQLARDNATLRAASDEGEGNQVALKERLKVVEAQLAHRESIDDAAVLRQELVQVQRVMDELTREKERERDELKTELQQLRELQASKELESSSDVEVPELQRKQNQYETELKQSNTKITTLEASLVSLKEQLSEAEKKMSVKISEYDALKGEFSIVTEKLQKQEGLCENYSSACKTLNHQIREVKDLNATITKERDQKADELKLLEARFDAFNKQKDILLSELQHKTRLCEELEKSSSDHLKALNEKKSEISRLESEKEELLVEIEAGEGANTAIQQLSQEKIVLSNQLKEQAEHISRSEEELRKVTKQLEDLQLENENTLLNMGNLMSRLAEVEENIQDAVLEIQNKDEAIDRLIIDQGECMARNDRLETSLAKNSKLLGEAGERAKALNLAVQECKGKADAFGEKNIEMENKVKEKEMEMNRLILDMTNLETRLSDAMSEVKNLQAQLNIEKSNNAKLQEEKNKFAHEMTKLSNLIAQKEEMISSLEQQKKSIQSELDDSQHEKKRIEEEGKKELELYKALLDESKSNISELEKKEESLLNEKQKVMEKVKELEESLMTANQTIKEKNESLQEESTDKESIKNELALEQNKCVQLTNEKLTNERELDKKADELKKVQSSLDEVAGEKLALEAQLAASQSEHKSLLERCYASSAESENQRKANADLRRRLEESQAALHELGRENQTLQLELEKLVGRKWTEDSDAASCTLCQKDFSLIVRKHHCRNCGQIFCNECSSKLAPLQTNKKPVRVCDSCYNELGNK